MAKNGDMEHPWDGESGHLHLLIAEIKNGPKLGGD